MHTSRRIIFITVFLLVLISAPIIIAGYADLSFAGAALSAHDKSYYYESAAQRLPWRTDLYEIAGVFAINAGEYQRAIALLQTVRLTPSVQLELGRAYALAGNNEKAVAELKSLLNDTQLKTRASMYLVDVYDVQGQFDDEEQILRQWLEFDSANVDAQYRLALLLFADASPDALPFLEFVASASPPLKPHVDGLRLALKTALDQPSTADRLTLCGQTLAAIGEWRLAQQTFSRAVQADSNNGLAWAWLGETRQQTASGDGLSDLQRAVTLSPDSPPVRAMFGLYWQRQHNWQKARAEFETAANLEPKNAVWQISLGDVYVQLGNLVEALDYYQNATRLDSKNPQTWRALALFSVENDVDIEGVGRAAALQAYALEPENSQNMDILGRALMETEQWDSAEIIFKKAIAAAPQDAAPLFHLALLYLQIGKPDLAKQYLQSAQALDPSGPGGTQAAKILARYFP